MTAESIEPNFTSEVKTPKADMMNHLQNFGEGGMYFSGALAMSLAAVYFKELEIVLAIAYIAGIIYSILSFDDSPRMAILRVIALTAGALLGLKELLILFPHVYGAAVLGVLALCLITFMAFRFSQSALS